jgi:opacity protein-like surface antigen
MRKMLLLGLLFPSLLHAQQISLDLFGGFANYQGDLQPKKFSTDQARGAFGLGLRYGLTDHFDVRANFTYARVGAADKFNKGNSALMQRNLSFETKITEGSLLLDYNILSLNYHSFTPYVFGGVAIYHFNPYAYDTLNNRVYLHPLSTEGEGLSQYPGRKPYHLTQFAIPFGGGIRWRVTDNVVLSYEIGLRKLFTDHLDDVSTTYVDEAALIAAKGTRAAQMAFRGDELKTGAVYPADGTKRGGSEFKDWYYFSGITVSIGIGSTRSRGGMSDRGNISCPRKVL